MERSYTDEELANIDPPPIEFEGREYTAYESTQKQRQLESALRNVKRRIAGMKAAGQDDAYRAAAIKYDRLYSEYRKFSEAAGLPLQENRANVPEFGPKEHREAVKEAKRNIKA